ncbi:MAG: D-alanine--D-alanine ligase [Alphaproteobacteria bacterium GM7ARS4]|nr:D-alanine--D-alanine ligase [Alphaproteobacteria bacterium GM7ARS4]
MSLSPHTRKKVAVLMGGWSRERAISLETGRCVYDGLCRLGHDVVALDVADRGAIGKIVALAQDGTECIFNALHGRWGEDGCVQGILECMGVPYTHSGVCASSLAMDKYVAQRFFMQEGLVCPPMKRCYRHQCLVGDEPFPRPYVIKPINEGSSVGVFVVREDKDVEDMRSFGALDDLILVQEFILGRELSVGVMGGKALGVIEIVHRRGFYDYRAKYDEGGSQHVMPAPIGKDMYGRAMHLSEQAYRCLGCRGIARVDWRLQESSNHLYMLEVNTQPGMTRHSLFPEIAAYEGIDFESLLTWSIAHATLDATAADGGAVEREEGQAC